jgi:hypothetical protein
MIPNGCLSWVFQVSRWVHFWESSERSLDIPIKCRWVRFDSSPGIGSGVQPEIVTFNGESYRGLSISYLSWCRNVVSTWDTSGLTECEHDMWQKLRGKWLFCVGIESPLQYLSMNKWWAKNSSPKMIPNGFFWVFQVSRWAHFWDSSEQLRFLPINVWWVAFDSSPNLVGAIS